MNRRNPRIRTAWGVTALAAALAVLPLVAGCHGMDGPAPKNYYQGPLQKTAMVGTRAGMKAPQRQ